MAARRIRTETRTLTTPLSRDEAEQSMRESIAAESQANAMVQQITELAAVARTKKEEFATGVGERDVTVEVFADDVTGEAFAVRTDTGEELLGERRPLRQDERA